MIRFLLLFTFCVAVELSALTLPLPHFQSGALTHQNTAQAFENQRSSGGAQNAPQRLSATLPALLPDSMLSESPGEYAEQNSK
jgi:hypothetical protein